jgi:hypothetical protein
MDTFLAVAKFLTLLIAGTLGVLGLRVEYKDDNGNITRGGKLALIGIIISTLIAATIQGVEVYKQKVEENTKQQQRTEEAQRANKLLTEVQRGVYNFRDISIDIETTYPSDHEAFAGYFKRFDEGAKQYIKTVVANNMKQNYDERYVVFTDDDPNQPYLMTIKSSDGLYPDKLKEKLAWQLLADSDITISIYKTPLSANETANSENKKPDVQWRIKLKGESKIENQFTEKKLASSAEWVSVDPKDFGNKSNGKVVSLVDLSGAQMTITFTDFDLSDDKMTDLRNDILKKAEINRLNLHFNGRTFYIPLKKIPSQYSQTYMYIFPPNMVEMDSSLSEIN